MSVTTWYDQVIMTNGYDPFEETDDPDVAYDMWREDND